jgi:hypothetical protein
MKTANRHKSVSCRPGPCLAVVLIILLGAGCSTSRLATGAMVPVLENARDAALSSRDIRTFEDAAPANIFLLEGLIRTDPNNVRLRLNAAMLYFSYAFAFVEDNDLDYASLLYLKGFEHGRAALFRNKKVEPGWEGTVQTFTDMTGHLRTEDVPASVWTAANWSQFISLHLDSTAVLVDIPRVVALLERATELDGAYFQGLPHIILGSLHAFRPPLMGGQPEQSLQNFERAFDISERKFLLTHYFFARHYCYRIQEPDTFEEALDEVLSQPADISPDYQLLNEIAKQRATQLLGEIDELF